MERESKIKINIEINEVKMDIKLLATKKIRIGLAKKRKESWGSFETDTNRSKKEATIENHKRNYTFETIVFKKRNTINDHVWALEATEWNVKNTSI